MSASASVFRKFDITSADGKKTVSLVGGITCFQYFEDLFSPTITAVVEVSATNLVDKGKLGESVYNSLPITVGSKVDFKVYTPLDSAQGQSEGRLGYTLYVKTVTDVIQSQNQEVFTLHLVSREAIRNQHVRVTKKYVQQSIDKIVKDMVQLTEPILMEEFEKCEGTINYIGNMRKPFTNAINLASKAIPAGAKSKTAGFFFWQTRKGFNFRSIKSLIKNANKNKKNLAKFRLTNDRSTSIANPARNAFKVLDFSITTDEELIESLQKGEKSTYRIFFNPLDHSFTQPNKSKYLEEPPDLLGKQQKEAPVADRKSIPANMFASRVITEILDVGTLTSGVSTAVNYNGNEYISQSIVAYGSLFTHQVQLTIPVHTELMAGDAVYLEIPKVESGSNEFSLDTVSGIYIIKEISHLFLANESYSGMRLIKNAEGI